MHLIFRYKSVITSEREVILNSDGIILPGVGAFPDAINNIKRDGIDKVLKEAVKRINLYLEYVLECSFYLKKVKKLKAVED